MNFFQSIFSDEAQSDSESDQESQSIANADAHPPTQIRSSPEVDQSDSAWSIGGIFKTLTIKSESMVETYRRDLKEFGDGIRKEIEVVQGSLGTVGHAIDEIGTSVLKGTAQIISHGTDALLSPPSEPESIPPLSSKHHTRLDSQISAIQIEAGTYTDEPDDLAEYENWRTAFDLDGKKDEMKELLESNKEMSDLHSRLVPDAINEDEFWRKYYFKVYKLLMAEDVRAKIVKRAISLDEELSWDVDDDEDSVIPAEEEQEREKEEESSVVVAVESEEKEDEMGWDEIEDMSAIDDRRKLSSANIADVRKQLQADDNDDVSWDIEDE